VKKDQLFAAIYISDERGALLKPESRMALRRS
jgi:hypothetical protein